MDDIQRTLGEHAARIDNMERRLNTIDPKLDLILQTLSEQKGGWKVVAAISGFSAALGAIFIKMIPFLK